MLLLGKGGRTVFLGRSEDALPYFNGLGFDLPPHINPADFFMDCIGGKYEPIRPATAAYGVPWISPTAAGNNTETGIEIGAETETETERETNPTPPGGGGGVPAIKTSGGGVGGCGNWTIIGCQRPSVLKIYNSLI